jgi:uncharacterized iron-regulated membrane protein
MLEAGGIFGLFAALMLVASVVIWAKRLRGPLLLRLSGRRKSNVRPTELVSEVLVLALGLSAVAAGLAIVGWIFT